MRKVAWLLLTSVAMAQAPPAPGFQPVASISQLMVNIIYPTSDAIFYVERKPPSTDAEWAALANQALILAESGNLLLMPGRARDQGDWLKDTKRMMNAGVGALKAARAKDLDGIKAVSDELYASCVACHLQYRPGYGKPKVK